MLQTTLRPSSPAAILGFLLLSLASLLTPAAARADYELADEWVDDEDEDGVRRGTTDFLVGAEGGFIAAHLDRVREGTPSRLTIFGFRLRHGLVHFETRRWLNEQVGARFELSLGGASAEHYVERTSSTSGVGGDTSPSRELVASQWDPAFVAGASAGLILRAGAYVRLMAALQYLFVWVGGGRAILDDYEKQPGPMSGLGASARFTIEFPHGVELGLGGRGGKMVGGDWFGTVAVLLMVRLHRHQALPVPRDPYL
ncbi:MAG: hypothetical protein CMN30_20030 [Sandaracinus sp.]|nr:hypothetical protein [Sandaracinus sp.]